MAEGRRVFICYANEDERYAESLYRDLRSAGADPWFSKKSLIAGRDWRDEIRKEIARCDYFIVLWSDRLLGDRCYAHKEVRLALEVMAELPPGSIFAIVARIKKCEVTYPQLQARQWVDLFDSWHDGVNGILRAMGFPPSKALADLTVVDVTTGLLYSPEFFLREMSKQRARVSRVASSLSLVLIGIDEPGLAQGLSERDACKKPVQIAAEVIATSLRRYDIAGRLSESVLAVGLPDVGGREARAVADRLLRDIRLSLPSELGVTISLGVASQPGSADEVSSLRLKAEEAMDMARARGGNRVEGPE